MVSPDLNSLNQQQLCYTDAIIRPYPKGKISKCENVTLESHRC